MSQILSQISQSLIKSGGRKSNHQSWITSIKLGSPEVELGGSESNHVVLGQFRWSWVKSVGPALNQPALSEIRWSCIKSGGPEQIRWS